MPEQIDSADVVIVGGGVTGLCSGWNLARAGVDVLVIEKGVIGYEASSRNGGIIAYHRGATPKGLLGYEEVRQWRNLEEELGYPCEYVPGEIAVCMGEHGDVESSWGGGNWDEMVADSERRNAMGWRSEVLDNKTMREVVPAINPNVVGGLYDPDAGQANPQRTVQAYAWALRDHGGRIMQHTTVTGFDVSGENVTTVRTDRGDIGAGFVVIAAGPQIGPLTDSLGAFVPIAPSRIEVIVTEPLPLMEYRCLEGTGLYGRQTSRGNLAYGGGGQEWVDVDDMTTPEKPSTTLIRTIARRLTTLFPVVQDRRIIRGWAGVSETTPDKNPIIDFLGQPANVVVASGAFDGFGLSPVHGRAVSELVMHGESYLPLDGYRLGRFADVPRNWREERNWVAGNSSDRYEDWEEEGSAHAALNLIAFTRRP